MFLLVYLEKKLIQISLSTGFVLGIAHNVHAEPYGTGGYSSCQYGQACSDSGSLTSTGVNFLLISSVAAIIIAGIIFYFLFKRRKNKENQPTNIDSK